MNILKEFEEYKEIEDYEVQRKVIDVIDEYTQMYYPYSDCTVINRYIINDLDILNLITQLAVKNQVNDGNICSIVFHAYDTFRRNNKIDNLPLVFDYFDGRGVFWTYHDFIHSLAVGLYSSKKDGWAGKVMMKVIEEIKLEE